MVTNITSGVEAKFFCMKKKINAELFLKKKVGEFNLRGGYIKFFALIKGKKEESLMNFWGGWKKYIFVIIIFTSKINSIANSLLNYSLTLTSE